MRIRCRFERSRSDAHWRRWAFQFASGGGFNVHLPCRSGSACNHVANYYTMWIMATAAVWLSGIKITRVQSNVRSNDCSVLKHRTKTKIRSVGRIGRFTCNYVASKAITIFLPGVFSIICYPLFLLSLWYLRHSWAQLNNRIWTEQHTTASAYDFTRTLVVQSFYVLPYHEFQKVVWTRSMRIWIRFRQMRITVRTCV